MNSKTHTSLRGRKMVRGGVITVIEVAALIVGCDSRADIFTDNFDDGNDKTPPIGWQRYDPIGMATGGTVVLGTWGFPGANSYRLQSLASPDVTMFGQARIGSLVPNNLTNFYVAADVVGWDPSIHQIFGLLARVGNVGPGTTSGYLLDWDSGDPSNPTAGDIDIVRVDSEAATDLNRTSFYGDDSVHLETGHSYRFVFMGVGGTFRGQVYDLAKPEVPLVDYGATDPAYDPKGSDHVSGMTGLLVADNSGAGDGSADATFDNFIATDGAVLAANFPLLSVKRTTSGGVSVLWPGVGSAPNQLLSTNLQSSPSLQSPNWTPVTNDIAQVGAENVYSVPSPTGTQFFRLLLNP